MGNERDAADDNRIPALQQNRHREDHCMMTVSDDYAELVSRLQETELLGSCSNVLGWDERTYMPEQGTEFRARQLALLAGVVHERRTDPRLGELLHRLESHTGLSDVHPDAVPNVREALRHYRRATRLSKAFVQQLAETISLSQQAWQKAREDSDFAAFLPWLTKVIALKREEAQAIGSASGVPYDALLDEYEPGMTTDEITTVFRAFRTELSALVAEVQQSSRRPNLEILERHYPVGAQRVFAEGAAKRIGFSFKAGRLDESTHPFCSGFGPGDCRLTTRFHTHHFNAAFFGTLHEAGHGIYEQGLRSDAFGLATGQACSLGVHESQSRLWENFVGRSRPFWEYFFPVAQQAFPAALADVKLDDFYFAINAVQPSFIRVEADELTYNLHIMLRFELEQQLIAGQLNAADVPDAWNHWFRESFGLTVPDAAKGCLQDIHWSAGLFGYFATYSLGNLFAAQLFEAAEQQLGDLADPFRHGEFAPLKNWLNQHVHQAGQRDRARELMQRVTGQPLSHRALMDHLRRKVSPLYGLTS
jgi:carboxypeptidase Taq